MFSYKEMMRSWVKRWEGAGFVLERLKREELVNANTQKAIELLDDAFESAIRLNPPMPTSGLVEQQRLFQQVKP